MNKQKLIPLFLLLVFLAPMALIIEHHHEDQTHHCSIAFGDAAQDATYEEAHEECAICEYEFSHVISHPKEIISQTSKPAFDFLNHYSSIIISGTENNSYALRAPPTFIV